MLWLLSMEEFNMSELQLEGLFSEILEINDFDLFFPSDSFIFSDSELFTMKFFQEKDLCYYIGDVTIKSNFP